MPDRFVRNSLFSTAAGLATAFGGFISMVIVARAVGVEGTGIVSYSLWIVLLTVTVADLGIHATMARYLPELKAGGQTAAADGLAARLLSVGAFGAVIAALFFAALALWLALQAQNPASYWKTDPFIWGLIAALALLQALASIGNGYLRGRQQFDRLARLAVIGLVLQLVAVAVGGLVAGHRGALAGYLTGSILQAVCLMKALTHVRGQADTALLARVRRFSLFAWAGAIAQTIVWTRLELFFLEQSLGPASVGLYAVALTFANLAAQGPMLLTGAMLPFFSEAFGQDADSAVRERAEQVFASATRIIAFLAFPSCLGLAAITPALLPLVYGQAFAGASFATMIVVTAAGISAAGTVGSHLIYGNDRSDIIFWVNLGGVGLSVLAGLLVIPSFGVEGAAWSRAAIHTTLVAAGCWFIIRKLGFPMPLKDLSRLLLAAAIAALAAGLTIGFIPGALGIAPAIAAAVIVYLPTVRILGGLTARDAQYLDAFLSRIPDPPSAFARKGITWLAPARGGSPA